MTYGKRDAHRAALQDIPPEDGGAGRAGATSVARAVNGRPAVPELLVRVNEGANIKVGEDAAVGKAGDYAGGDEVVLEGPTAHHYEEMGYVTILGEAS